VDADAGGGGDPAATEQPRTTQEVGPHQAVRPQLHGEQSRRASPEDRGGSK
jgi:hypothetical protein